MWIVVALALLLGWFLLKLVWHVATGAVHLLLVLGALALVFHVARTWWSSRGTRPGAA